MPLFERYRSPREDQPWEGQGFGQCPSVTLGRDIS
jgi:hypothetical protein